jgi:hypothetical protein
MVRLIQICLVLSSLVLVCLAEESSLKFTVGNKLRQQQKEQGLPINFDQPDGMDTLLPIPSNE